MKRRKIFKSVVICILFIIVAVCLYKIIPYFLNLAESEKEFSTLAEEVITESSDTTENTNEEYDWQSVMIDFDYLQSINPDVVAWIRFDNTDVIRIDYPVMYNADNDVKYLHANWKQEYSYAGSIFMESLNSPDFSDAETILYGHNMKNGSMFGTLKKYRYSKTIYENNKYYTIYTPQAAYRYEIFSYFVTDSSSFVYTVGFTTGTESYEEQIAEMNARSSVGSTATADDQITVLSTCVSGNDKNERFVVVGKLIDTYEY